MIKRMEDIQRRLALKFRVNKIENSGVHGPILLNELFHNKDKNSSTKLVEGFLKINTEEPEVCWHLRVEDENEIVYDINKTLACMRDPGFENIEFEYMKDVDNPEKPEELSEQWKLYQDDKKEFWKKSPQNLKNFRSKIFRNF